MQNTNSPAMISMDKKYKTRSGEEVRLFTTEAKSCHPVIGERKHSLGWSAAYWCESGRFANSAFDHDLDLIEVREPREWSLSIHHDNTIPTLYVDGDEHQGWCKEVVDVREILDGDSGEGGL